MHLKTLFSSISSYLNMSLCNFFFSTTLMYIYEYTMYQQVSFKNSREALFSLLSLIGNIFRILFQNFANIEFRVSFAGHKRNNKRQDILFNRKDIRSTQKSCRNKTSKQVLILGCLDAVYYKQPAGNYECGKKKCIHIVFILIFHVFIFQ